MPECKNCKFAIWDCVDYYPSGRQYYVEDCELGNDEEDCQDFEEYVDPDYLEGW